MKILDKVIVWVGDQREKAKVAWLTVAALVAYLSGLLNQLNNLINPGN